MPLGAFAPESEPPHGNKAGLAGAVVAGLMSYGGSQVVSQILQMGLRLILARLLAPEDFGRAAMVLVVYTVAEFFTDAGVVQFLVQRPEFTRKALHTGFWIHAFLGACASVLALTLAPLVASFFGDSSLTPMLRTASLALLLGSLGAPPAALLLREMRFSALAWRQMIGVLVGSAVAIVLAVRQFGAWALVWERIAVTAATALTLFVAAKYLPRFAFDRGLARDIWAFGVPLRGSLLVNMVGRQFDRILIGKLLGAAELGIYNLAYQGILRPLQFLSRPVAQVLFPAMARLQESRERLGRALIRASGFAVALLWPPVVLGYIWAPKLVPLVLGGQWARAVVPLQFLALGSLPLLLSSILGAALTALAQSTLIFRLSLFGTLGSLAIVAVTAPAGIAGVAAGLALWFWVQGVVQVLASARVLALPFAHLFLPLAKGMVTVGVTLTGYRWLSAALPWPELTASGLFLLVWVTAFFGELRQAVRLVVPRSAGVPSPLPCAGGETSDLSEDVQ